MKNFALLRNIFFIATQLEALQLINQLKGPQKLDDHHQNIPSHWIPLTPETMLIITGIGPYTAHLAVDEYILFFGKETIKNHRWINLGIAGVAQTASQKAYEIGSWAEVDKISLLDWHPRTGHSVSMIAKTINLSEKKSDSTKAPRCHLITSTLPIYESEPLLKSISADHETTYLIDMESYALAFLAERESKGIEIFKIVSDSCNKSSSSEIRAMLPRLAEKIAERAIQLI